MNSHGMRKTDAPPAWNRITETVIGCALEVHSTLGPGLLERFYEEALCYELERHSVPFVRQAPILMRYKELALGNQFVDVLVADILVLELKSIERVSDEHLAKLVNYLRAGGYPLGLLLNFNTMRLRDGIFRRANTRATPAPPAFLDTDLAPRLSAPSASPRSPLPS